MKKTQNKVKKTQKMRTQKRTQKRTQNTKRGGSLFSKDTLVRLADKWNDKSRKRLVKKTGLKADQFTINCINRDDCIKSSENVSAVIKKQGLTKKKEKKLMKILEKFKNNQRNFR
tara:strand:+ start:249 stop:593 length:345 start_codon:yes stop_codon:yes gene_type:complete